MDISKIIKYGQALHLAHCALMLQYDTVRFDMKGFDMICFMP